MKTGKAILNNEVIYGVLLSPRWHKDAYNNIAAGEAVLEHALTGKYYVIAESSFVEIKHEYDDQYNSVDEYNLYVTSEFHKACKGVPAKFGVGSMFSTGVGDGSAWYIVTAVAKTTCTVKWRAFEPDSYVDITFGHGGKHLIQNIKPMCESREQLLKLIS